jgi:hypothetical protein
LARLLAKHVFGPIMRFGGAHTVGDPDSPPTLFVHIPRTAGDAIRTAVFPHLTWDRNDIRSPVQCLDNAEIEVLRQHRVAKGFLSHIDIAKLSDEVRLVTFLRDPLERVLSLHRFRRGGEGAGRKAEDVAGFVTTEDSLIRAHARNGMTWQLGDALPIASRSCTADEAQERARALLERCAFVGFYEDLEPDVPQLARQLLAKVRSPVPMLGLFRLGALAVAHRRRVRKYAATLTARERELLIAANQQDLALYAWARQRAGRSNALHDDYRSWLAS